MLPELWQPAGCVEALGGAAPKMLLLEVSAGAPKMLPALGLLAGWVAPKIPLVELELPGSEPKMLLPELAAPKILPMEPGVAPKMLELELGALGELCEMLARAFPDVASAPNILPPEPPLEAMPALELVGGTSAAGAAPN